MPFDPPSPDTLVEEKFTPPSPNSIVETDEEKNKRVAQREGAKVLSPWEAINTPFTEYITSLKPYVRGGVGFAAGGGLTNPKGAVEGAIAANIPEGVPVTGAEGVAQGLADQAEAIFTPLGVATLGIAKLPVIAQKAISVSFAALALKNAPKAWTEFREAVKSGDQGNATRAFINLGGNMLMGIAAAKHATSPIKAPFEVPKPDAPLESKASAISPIAPLTAEALKQTAAFEPPQPESDAPSATQERQQQESIPSERPGGDAQRVSTETSVGGGVQPAEEITPAQPTQTHTEPPAQLSDYEQYQKLVSDFKAAPVEQKFEIQKQIEEIKNRNGGMPPKFEPPTPGSVTELAPETPKTPETVVLSAEQLKVSAPEGATQIRVTDNQGRTSTMPLSVVNKGDNPFRGVDIAKIESGTIGKDKKFTPVEGPISVSQKSVLKPGPGAGTLPGVEIQTDIGQLESNIPPLEKLSQAVRAFPEQKGSFTEKLNQWMDDVGVVKDKAIRAVTSLRSIPAWIKAKATTLPEVHDIDRRVGEWNKQDWIGGQAARTFKQDVSKTFSDRSKLRALSNWINAGGDKETLQKWADGTINPALKKTYEDALKFGPQEEMLARAVRQYHDEMLAWAQQEGALEEGLDNYLHRYYREGDPGLESKQKAYEYLKFTKDFNGFKKRYYESDFDAEQTGKDPEKDAVKRILAYDYGFRRALIAREFVKNSYNSLKAVAPDGRPELDLAGNGTKVEDDSGKKATLIRPKSRLDTGDPKDYRGDYVSFNHPAFRKWKFATTDTAGKPVLVQGDVLVHPAMINKYKALFDTSWWSKTPVRRAFKGVSGFVKQTMLQGPFHLVQITTGGIEHRINPFKLLDIDTSDPAQQRMTEAGLFPEEGPYFTEGVSGGGLMEKIPVAGEYFQQAKDFLFQDYIPRWKMTLALEIEKRARERYSKDLASGKITLEQITRMAARQSAAVFGGQNQRAIFRSKTFQDNLRMAFLAPDFGEERIRQLVQATSKYGHEQRAALVAGAMGMMVVAKTIEMALTGKIELAHPFTVTYQGREYGLRNPASDAYHLFTDPIGYARNRLNPIYTRPLLELASGRDAFGRKRSAGKQLADEIKQIVPIPARGLIEKEQTFWESFLNSLGVTEHRRTAFGDTMKSIASWKDKQGHVDPREIVYDPDKDPYHPLTSSLSTGDSSRALKQLNEMVKGKTEAQRQKIYEHYKRSLSGTKYLTGSKALEAQFLGQASESEKSQYESAKNERAEMWKTFQRAWANKNPIDTSK